MNDIDLYQKEVDSYEDIQNKRPDYRGAREMFTTAVSKFFASNTGVNIVDFCCGTGNNSVLASSLIDVDKVTLVDINEKFLEIARKANIKAKTKVFTQSDIIDVHLEKENDLVISMFAYHHVPDTSKKKYVEIARSCLKKGGVVILGEIYSPNKSVTIEYYNHLIDSIDVDDRTKELEKFLTQTAKSDDFEYKVSMDFAHRQFEDAGFVNIQTEKIWPHDNLFDYKVGTFVEVWRYLG